MKHRIDSVFSSLLLLLAVFAIASSIPRDSSLSAAPQTSAQEETSDEIVGERPYEMVWAGRDREVREPLVDFENLDGWTVETQGSVATFERSREEQMYGKYVGKLTYRRSEEADVDPVVDVRPPQPIPIADDADAYSCWAVGNNWAWETDASTPRVLISVLFQTASGEELALPLETVAWKNWFLCYKIIPKASREKLGSGAKFSGLRVAGGLNVEDRTVYFDSLCVFKEELKPLTFTPRAKPGIDLFEGQPLGINSGEGRLPFPTTPDTILPDSAKNLEKPASHFYGNGCDFVYEGSDGTLVYRYSPKKGDWSDLTVAWNSSKPMTLGAGGGIVQLAGENGELEDVEKAELLEFKPRADGIYARWNLTSKTASEEVEYRFELRGKSLIVDTIALGGKAPKVEFGRIEDVVLDRVVKIPYYLYVYGQRPGTAIVKPLDGDQSLFISAHIDWYRSGASYLQGSCGSGKYERQVNVGQPGSFKLATRTFDYAIVNGGAEYRTKLDGTRNDVYERFIFTVSPDFAETLPSIPNPKSPYRDVAGKGVWRSHGATTREYDKAHWTEVWRRGMRHIIVTDHEVCWRDAGESFTFRTKPAPKKGGDAGWIDYSRYMQDDLGFVYGPYNNFTDFAPVNEYWSPDMVSRQQDGQLQRAWARCYAPKPTRAVEFCEKLTPIIQEKFKFSCAYCDVHSSVPPWTRTDYDPRVPGAGTFMSVFYPYGELFLLQKQNWKGPTYSEGPHHCFYAGLVDGNYAQDQPYKFLENPWLLDFDLLKIHDQEVDFGMGDLSMFAPGYRPSELEDKIALIDRFLAATLAFGHSGYLALDCGMEEGAKSYFMIQQIAARYTQTSVESIRYIDADGVLLDTNAALLANVVARDQACVHYQDGTVVVVNGSPTEPLHTEVDGRTIDLPPLGYVAWTSDGEIFVESSLSETGERFDYCESPEYIYVNGRGSWTNRPRACGAGSCACRILGDDQFEIIPEGDAKDFGFKLVGPGETASAVALDYDRNEIGPANVRFARGYLFVEPVDGAFSYIVAKKPIEGESKAEWTSDRFAVASGEKVVVKNGENEATWTAPEGGQNVHLFFAPDENSPENAIDFLVVPFANVKFTANAKPRSDDLATRFQSSLPRVEAKGTIKLGEAEPQTLFAEPVELEVGKPFDAVATLPDATSAGEEKGVAEIEFTSSATGAKGIQKYELTFENVEKPVPFEGYEFMDNPRIDATPFLQRRGEDPSRDFDGSGATHLYEWNTCGGDSKISAFIHPPYQGGPIGRTFIRFNFQVPNDPAAVRLEVGKRDGSDYGDGILYQVAVAEFDGDKIVEGTEKTLAETRVKEHEWLPLEADLSEYAGKSISLLLIADPGGDTTGDWACATLPTLETAQTRFVRTLKKAVPIE